MKKVKSIMIVLLLVIVAGCSNVNIDQKANNGITKEQQTEEENQSIQSTAIAKENEAAVYLVESIDNLHLDSEKFNIENYFIRNECQYPNHYYIDSDNILWGYGDNEYGQLGNGQQYSRDADGEYRIEMTPQKIAENVIHVDFGGYFVIFLTENGGLYGIGANLNGVMGVDASEDYVENPAAIVVTEPVCLMQDVTYARASRRGIVALKKDGSVWWWGEIRTTSAKNSKDTKGVSYTKPEKMLDDAVYVTCGDFSIAAIKEDGTLWTWGNNTFGSCGYDSNDKDFIEEPVMVLEDVTGFLDGLDIDYKVVDGISEEEKVYEIITEDQYFTFCFDDKHKLTAIYYSAYGTRNGKINIGMTREEVEAVLNKSCFDEIYGENNRYITTFYQDDNIYEVGYFDGIVYYVEESMVENMPENI